jgi:hypothetical protein
MLATAEAMRASEALSSVAQLRALDDAVRAAKLEAQDSATEVKTLRAQQAEHSALEREVNAKITAHEQTMRRLQMDMMAAQEKLAQCVTDKKFVVVCGLLIVYCTNVRQTLWHVPQL